MSRFWGDQKPEKNSRAENRSSPIKAIAVLLYCFAKPYPSIQEMALKKLKTPEGEQVPYGAGLPPTIYTFSVISTLSLFVGSVARSLALFYIQKWG